MAFAIGLSRLCRNGFLLRRCRYRQDGAARLSRFDHSLNWLRQPGDFSNTAHKIIGFLDLSFGRTDSNWAEPKHLHLSCKALIVRLMRTICLHFDQKRRIGVIWPAFAASPFAAAATEDEAATDETASSSAGAATEDKMARQGCLRKAGVRRYDHCLDPLPAPIRFFTTLALSI